MTEGQSPDSLGPGEVSRLHTEVPHVARVYDYWLSGKDNFTADRVAAEETIAAFPGIRLSAQANRAFLRRTVRYLAAEEGIRQFLDIGTGLPAADNTHEVSQAVAPESRVVYVDNDPLVLAHARALLTSGPQGATAYLDADLRDTDTILEQAAATLDFTRPVAIMLLAILHYIPDLAEARQIVAKLLGAVPSGSFLVISHAGTDLLPDGRPGIREEPQRPSRRARAPRRAQARRGARPARRPHARGPRPGPRQRMAPRHPRGSRHPHHPLGRRSQEALTRLSPRDRPSAGYHRRQVRAAIHAM